MKAKKILFLLAGIINTLIGGFCAFIGVIAVLFKGLMREMLETSYDIVQNYIKALAEQDASYEYLLNSSKSENIDFVMKTIMTVGVVFLIIGLVYITFGVLNLLLSKQHNNILNIKKYLGVLLIVFSWILMLFNVANI